MCCQLFLGVNADQWLLWSHLHAPAVDTTVPASATAAATGQQPLVSTCQHQEIPDVGISGLCDLSYFCS